MQEVKVWSLIRELRSHMPWDQKKNKKQKTKKPWNRSNIIKNSIKTWKKCSMSKNFLKKFLLMPVCTQSLQFCLTPCCPMDCSPPGFSVHGILQTRILEWVAMPSSRGSSWPKGWRHGPCASCIGRQILSCWATREALVMPEPLLNYDADEMWLWRLSFSLLISLPAFPPSRTPTPIFITAPHLACPFHVGPITYQAVPKLKSPSESAPKSSDSEQLTGHEQVTSRNPAERCSEEEKKEDMQGKEEWSG